MSLHFPFHSDSLWHSLQTKEGDEISMFGGPCLQSSISTLSFSFLALFFFCCAVSSCVYDHNHPYLVSERLFLAENKAFSVPAESSGAPAESSGYTLLLLLFASTKFCDFEIPTILRVLIFAISRSQAKFCDFAHATEGKSSTLKSIGLVNVAVSRLKLLQCKVHVVFV